MKGGDSPGNDVCAFVFLVPPVTGRASLEGRVEKHSEAASAHWDKYHYQHVSVCHELRRREVEFKFHLAKY